VPSGSFVLIHGGGTTGRFWDRLLPLLDGRALAVDLPGRGAKPADLESLTVEEEVVSVVADIAAAQLPPPLVLVAHSSGGLVVPGLLTNLHGSVGHVVLNAASIPPEGGCGLDCMRGRHRDGIMMALEMQESSGRPLLTPGPPDDPETFRRAYGGPPLSDEDLAFVVDPSRCVVDTMSHYFQPIRWESAPAKQVTYVVNLLDRPVPVELQREMAARLPYPPSIIELECGHIPAIVEPGALARILNALA
jgi:pimeloyl-ACP methyl ester carboxylesterase